MECSKASIPNNSTDDKTICHASASAFEHKSPIWQVASANPIRTRRLVVPIATIVSFICLRLEVGAKSPPAGGLMNSMHLAVCARQCNGN